MENQTIFIIISILEIICAIIMREIAKRRHANQAGWFFVGLVFGPIALLFIPFIK